MELDFLHDKFDKIEVTLADGNCADVSEYGESFKEIMVMPVIETFDYWGMGPYINQCRLRFIKDKKKFFLSPWSKTNTLFGGLDKCFVLYY